MKTYVVTTGVVFGLLALAHVWRVREEGRGVLNPPFVAITVLAAAFSVWAFLLVRKAAKPNA